MKLKGLFSILGFILLTNAQVIIAANYNEEPVYQFGSNEVVGTSVLLRSTKGVSFRVETYGPGDGRVLDGHMATVWLVVFNAPENCTIEGGSNGHPICSLDDVMNAMSGGPNAPQIDILYGAGNIIGNGAESHFAGYKKVADLSKSTFGIGLLDATRAEIHLVVRSHGPIAAGLGEYSGNVAESIGSFIGGCQGIPWYADLGVIPVNEGQCNDIFYSVQLSK